MAYTWCNLADLEWKLGHEQHARAALAEAQRLAEHLNLLTLLTHIGAHPAAGKPKA